MAARNALLQRPQWVIGNQLTMPLITIADNGKKSVRGLVTVIVPFTIFLDTIFAEKFPPTTNTGRGKRSSQQDQFQLFKSIEGALQVTGMDGKACLLRTICEIQRTALGDTLAGEVATLLLTPKRGEGGLSGFLQDYLIAERVGHSNNQSCSDSFPRCPMSLFDIFRSPDTNDHDEISQTKVLDSKINKNMSAKKALNKNAAAHHQEWLTLNPTTIAKKHPFGMENLIQRINKNGSH